MTRRKLPGSRARKIHFAKGNGALCNAQTPGLTTTSQRNVTCSKCLDLLGPS